MKNAVLQFEGGQLCVKGSLHFNNVGPLFEQGCRLLKENSPFDIDLSGVTYSDSAGIALLVAWKRAAYETKRALQFKNIPPQMQNLVRICGIENMLELRTAHGNISH